MYVPVLLVIFSALFVGTAFDLDIPPETVDSLDVKAFTGRWYQMYASLIPNKTYESGGKCITADYALLPSKKDKVRLGVLNSQR